MDFVTLAQELDSADPLARFRDEFVMGDPDLIYLDGNSLGRLPKRTTELMSHLMQDQWGNRLVRGWGDGWVNLPQRVGGKIAELIGAHEDEVLVCDSTSINFYKIAMAALERQQGRSEIVTDHANFPSDLYVLQGCAKQFQRNLLVAEPKEVARSLSDRTALLSLTHVAFKSGFIHPMQSLTAAAHEVGALVLWDLSHSVGSVPVDLGACGVDLAVGCTYKYLNGGPALPRFYMCEGTSKSSY